MQLYLTGFLINLTPTQECSWEYGESFKNIYFKVHPQTNEREVKARFSVSVIAEYGKNNIAKNKAKIAR